MQLLGKGGLAALTTNAVAEKAGVSIGTLYQYFGNKEAILDALADRGMASLSERVLGALQESGETTPAERLAAIIRAITASYGGRRQVHRLVMQHSLAQGGRRLAPLIDRLVALLTTDGPPADGGRRRPASRADAFVITNAFAGVMRAMILSPRESAPPQEEIEAALVRLVLSFAGQATPVSRPTPR